MKKNGAEVLDVSGFLWWIFSIYCFVHIWYIFCTLFVLLLHMLVVACAAVLGPSQYIEGHNTLAKLHLTENTSDPPL